MTKSDVIAALRRYALVTELLGEDTFRARAFESAARSLETTTEDIDTLVFEGLLERVRGIGKTVSSAIRELHTSGEFADLARATSQIPPGVFDLLRVDGLGPKKARMLWREGSIISLDDLERAILEGRVQKLSGFGAKSAEKFLSSIAFLREIAGRHWRHHAVRTADLLLNLLSTLGGVKEVFFGGSFARGMETVRDLDVLLIVHPENQSHTENAIRALSQQDWRRIDEQRWTGTFQDFEIDLGLAAPSSAAPRKLLMTGSRAHYAALQLIARQKGFTLDADFLRKSDGQIVAVNSEIDIYHHLGLEPVPAALREFEDSLVPEGTVRWPQTVQLQDFRGILHNHTIWSDGLNSLREMAEAMIEANYEYIGIADHSKAAAYANGLTPERIRSQWREIDLLNEELRPFRILKGTECDILSDGRLDYDDELLSQFDFVVASIHSGFSMTEIEATHRLCKALENPHVDILGHPTGRLLLERPGYSINHEQVIDCAAKYGKAIELNANSHRLDLDWRWIRHCNSSGVPIPINPDAHNTDGLKDVRFGIDVAAKGPLSREQCPPCWSSEEFLNWCNSHN